MWTDQFLGCDHILDTRKESLSRMVAPPLQPRATFTSDLQTSRPYPGLLLVPKMAWPNMTRPAALGTTQTPVPRHPSLQVLPSRKFKVRGCSTWPLVGGAGHACPWCPRGGRAQGSELGLLMTVWHTRRKSPQPCPPRHFLVLSFSPYPKTLSISFTNTQPLWAGSLWILRKY